MDERYSMYEDFLEKMAALQMIQTLRIEESLAQDANIRTSSEARPRSRTIGAVTPAPLSAPERPLCSGSVADSNQHEYYDGEEKKIVEG